MSPRIHVFLPVHNRRATTEKFVRCLLAQSYTNWHLLLIDDGSTDNTADMVRTLVSSATVLRGEGDWWWAGALHQGYEWLRRAELPVDDLVLINNDDTEFDSDFLTNAVAAMKPRSLLVAQAYKLATGEFCEAGVYWDWKAFTCTAVREGTDFNCFSTRGLFLRAGDFLEIGGFYPKLLPHYLSDYEFTMRAHRKGFALITAPEVRLYYDEGLTGIRSTEGQPFFRAVRMTFSKRSSGNPVYWTSFVLLSSPKRYVPLNAIRVWWRVIAPIRAEVRQFLAPARRVLGRIKRKLKRAMGIQAV
jgi:GT2 family glycosyltransferase